MDATAIDPLVGQVLDGRYRIDSRIARGGMATVYLSHDLKLDRTVALKVMHPNLAQDEDFVRRFSHEAKAAAALSHPNIVAVFDQGRDGAHVFLAMEYVPGRTLRDVLTQRGRLGPREALGIMQPMLAALAAAHRAGLVHRDVKPENVLVMEDGRIKVADFGLARAESAGKQTKTGVLLGTVGYLAPEQVLSGNLDARADVYAAGIMLFELLTGRQPYDGDSPLTVAYRHVNEIVPLPSSWLPGLPAQLDALVATATSRDPARRPPDAGHFLTAVTDAYRLLPPDIDQTMARAAPPGPVQVPTGGTMMMRHAEIPRATTTEFAGEYGGRPAPVERMGALFTSRYLLIFLGVLAVVIIGWAVWYQTSGQYDTIPKSVIGMSMTDAKTKLEAAGLSVKTGKSAYDNKVPKDHVLRVSPEPGSRYKAGDVVTLYPSKGRFPIEVPDVTNKTLDQAKAELQATGLTPGAVERDFSDTVPPDLVVRTEPEAHDKQQPEEPVTIVLSNGIKLADFTGWKREDAESWLRQHGLNPQFQEQDDRTKDPNTVLSQTPAPGTGVKQGDTITLQVNKKDCVIFGFFCDDGGKNNPPPNPQDLVPVPDVHGQPIHDAAQALQAAGFKVGVRRQTAGDTVLSQTPPGGQPAPRGSRVTLVR